MLPEFENQPIGRLVTLYYSFLDVFVEIVDGWRVG